MALASLLLLFCLGYVAICILVFVFQSRLIYHPSRHVAATPGDCGLSYEETVLALPTEGRVCGWFVPSADERGVVLFCHGNAGNIGDRLDTIRILHNLAFSVFIFDYRGYGQSSGRPTEAGSYEDARAAWQHLVRERRYAPDRIVLFGRSLGGAIAAWLATQYSPGALVLEAAFTSIQGMGRDLYPFLPVRLLSRYDYATAAHVSRCTCPSVIVHSAEDELVGVHHGRELFSAAPEPKHFVPLSGTHNDGFLMSGSDYTKELDGALSRYFPRAALPDECTSSGSCSALDGRSTP